MIILLERGYLDKNIACHSKQNEEIWREKLMRKCLLCHFDLNSIHAKKTPLCSNTIFWVKQVLVYIISTCIYWFIDNKIDNLFMILIEANDLIEEYHKKINNIYFDFVLSMETRKWKNKCLKNNLCLSSFSYVFA